MAPSLVGKNAILPCGSNGKNPSATDVRSLHSQAEWPKSTCSPLWSCFSEYTLHPGSHVVVMVHEPCAGSYGKQRTLYKVSDPVIVPLLSPRGSFFS